MIAVERTPPEGAEEWLDVRNRVWIDDPLDLNILRAVQARFPDRVDLLARLDGAPAGVAFYKRLLDDPVSPIGRITLGVLPEHRRRGVATALHRAVSEVARGHADEELESQVVAPGPEAEAYAAARGYRRVQRMLESRLDLTRRDAAPRAPDGVRFVSAAERPDVFDDAYLVSLEAEPDIPDSRPYVRPSSAADWRAREVDEATLIAEASLVAYIEGEPAAYGIVTLERAGVGANATTGVTRAHRGRGLATALKRAQIERARATGLRELRTWNDEANAPIRRVNEKLGFRVVHEVVTYRGPLL